MYVYAPRLAFSTPRLADLMEQIPQRFTALKIKAANFSETFARVYQTTARGVTCDVIVAKLCIF